MSLYSRPSASNVNSDVKTTQTQNTSSSSSQNASNSGTREGSSSTIRGTASSRQALELLIKQLSGGGTVDQRRRQAEIARTLQMLDAQASQYTQDRALQISEEAVNSNLRKSLEATLPSILLAGASAGTSGSAIAALLVQDRETRAAGEAAELGVDLSARYGGITAQLLSTRGDVASTNTGVAETLLSALKLAQTQQEVTKSKEKTTGSQSASSSKSSTSIIDSLKETREVDDESALSGGEYNRYANG